MTDTPSEPTGPAASVHQAKSIVLFSDGTGNSSGKLFKTNVWRMYEAVDLGPSPSDKRDQIAYYDNGVGTTSFRPLRLLQGAFGWGLKRNVLEIYRYACRNYKPGEGQEPGQETENLGDHFYGFGFSRGAFTMRLAIDLIAVEGIVTFKSERELAVKTKEAFRHWQRSGPSLGLKAWPTQLWRLFSNRVISPVRRRIQGSPKYASSGNYKPVIKFIGVWDTVAAYGGPIIEVTRAIDMFVYPLSMASYRLNPRVRCARHALALDEERDSFQPLLWDEIEEQELVEKSGGKIAADRLEQVWFTGMHADVGGGYPDESLSYVSLLWMMDEAETAELRTLDVITERYVALANSYGPMHDSRAGLASYYRYQPRKIAALIEESDSRKARSTLSLRDPAIKRKGMGSRGLLREAKVHESVIARIAYGTDSYAPIVLPERFKVVPPGNRSEAQPQAVSDAPPGCRRAKLNKMKHAVLGAEHRARLAKRRVVAALGQEVEKAWNLVWIRRVVYFATVIATIALLLLPVWGDDWNPFGSDAAAVGENILPSDDRSWIGNLIRLPTAFLPEFLHGWVEGLARSPWMLIGLAVLVLLLNSYARRLERILRDRAGRCWRKALGMREKVVRRKRSGFVASVLVPALDWIEIRTEALRHSGGYQRPLGLIKWYVLPWAIGLVILALLVWLALAVITQVRLPALEAGEALCESTRTSTGIDRIRIGFHTNRLCNPVGARVRAAETYTITFQVVRDWKDDRYETSPLGLNATGIGWRGPFGVPLRRVVNAHYLQPIVEIRNDDTVQIHAPAIEEVPGDTNEYRMEFSPRIDGELFLFANDAVLLSGFGPGHDYFYRNNHGEACVTIERRGATAPLPAAAQTGPCGKPAAPRRPDPRRPRQPPPRH
jgi:uncharacterized protein (DUF2235 family)